MTNRLTLISLGLICGSVVIASASNFSRAQVTGESAGRAAAVAPARGEVSRARTRLQSAVAKVRSTWQSNPKLIEATDNVAAAQKDFDAARRSVVERLKSDPTHAALLKTQGDMQSKVADEQAKTKAAAPPTTRPQGTNETVPNLPPPSDALIESAGKKLENKAKLRNLEEQAIAEDPVASKAQERLNEAQKVAKVWTAQFDATLQNDPEFRAAHDQLAAARSALVAAGAVDVPYDNYGETVYGR